MDAEIVTRVIVGLLTAGLGGAGWIVAKIITDIREIDRAHAALALKVSENYATKSDLNSARGETKDSLDRLHLRIDDLADNVDNKMTDIQGDIKTLLRKS